MAESEGLKKVSISSRNLALAGIISGVAGVYLSGFSIIIPAVLTIPIFLWGADVLRRIAGYGIGTGVPSIGNLAASMGIITALIGLKFQPAFGIGFAAFAGWIYGVIISRFKILEIPSFPRFMLELSVSSCIALLCMITVIVGGYSPLLQNFMNAHILPAVFATGFVIIVYWTTGIGLFHPFNASLGAGERQARTLRVSIVITGMNVVLIGFARVGYTVLSGSATYYEPVIVVLIGIIVWIYGLYALFKASSKEAAMVTWTGIPRPKR